MRSSNVFVWGDQVNSKRRAAEYTRHLILAPTSPRATIPADHVHICPMCGEPMKIIQASAHRRDVHPLGR